MNGGGIGGDGGTGGGEKGGTVVGTLHSVHLLLSCSNRHFFVTHEID